MPGNAFDRAPDRRDPRRLNKWTYYPGDVIPMWVADMDFRSAPPILAALRKALDHGVLGYELPSRALYEAVAARMQRLYGWKVDPQWITAVTGTVSGFNVAARAFCTERKGYLIQSPVYNEFHELRSNLGLRQHESPLVQTVTRNILNYDVDWNSFERQVRKTGIFLLCSPHNPLGMVFSRRDLKRMADICLKHDVVIVADEIHSELLLGGQSFTPMAKAAPEARHGLVTLVSPSKTFNIPGLFCGFAIIPDRDLREQYNRVAERLRMHVSSFGLFAAQEALSGSCDAWLEDLKAYLTANRDFLVDYVTQYLPDVRVTQPEATYLAWLDCSELVRKNVISGSPFDFFINRAKVAFGDGKIYGVASAEFVRLNFGCTRRTLKQGLDRVRDSLYRRKNA